MSMLVKSVWYTSTIVPHQPFILSSIKQNIKTINKRRNKKDGREGGRGGERGGRRRDPVNERRKRIHVSLFFLVHNISIDLCLEVHSFFLLTRSVFTRYPPPSLSLLFLPLLLFLVRHTALPLPSSSSLLIPYLGFIKVQATII